MWGESFSYVKNETNCYVMGNIEEVGDGASAVNPKMQAIPVALVVTMALLGWIEKFMGVYN